MAFPSFHSAVQYLLIFSFFSVLFIQHMIHDSHHTVNNVFSFF